MKAQIPHSSIAAPSSTHVRVNPTVAKLVASHIHQANAGSVGITTVTQSSVSSARAPSPAIINLGSASRSQSPTVVKVVSVSRTSSPAPKVGASVLQAARPPVAPPPPLPRAENPVATINIKGLPPGVSIPASLVNSLVSGSIGGISKGGLIRGPSQKTVVRNPPPEQSPGPVVNHEVVKSIRPQITTNGGLAGTRAAPAKLEPPDYRVLAGLKPNPEAASASPASPNAWSNPNLVIRTRRASVQQNNPPQTRAPQVGPNPTAPRPLEIPTVVTDLNGPPPANHIQQNHIDEEASLVAKKMEVSGQNVPDSNGNGSAEQVIQFN